MVSKRPISQRCNYRRKHATWWKRIGDRDLESWLKVQAHVAVKEQPDTEEEIDIWLNDRADTRAKETIAWHGLMESAQEDYKTAAGRVKAALREIGANLAEHPRPRDRGIEYIRQKKGRKLVVKTRQPHQWYMTGRQTWRCRQCWREKKVRESPQDYAECGNVVGTMAKLGLNAHAHSLTAAVVDCGPDLIMWCRRCGGIAEVYAKWLAQPTCRKPTAATGRVLRKIGESFHPSRNAVLSDLWDLTGGHGTQHAGEGAKAWDVAGKQQERTQHGTPVTPDVQFSGGNHHPCTAEAHPGAPL